MAGLKYTYIPLQNATLVERRHDREVTPPGLVTLKNFISSRSDDVPTLRPDIIDDATIKVKAYRTLLGDGTLTTTDEYLNSAFGLYGGENLIYLTSRFPLDNSTDVTLGTYSGIEYSTIKSKLIDNGTATAHFNDNNENVVISDSTQINMNQKAWYGACILIDGDTTYYPIRLVTDKSTVVLESLSDVDNSTAAFKVLQSHCPENDGYKFHTELFLSNSIYNTPIFANPFSTQRMSGPFIGNITTETDYIDYTGTFTQFTVAQSTQFQNQFNPAPTSEYNSETLSKKFGATGLGIYMCTKPFYEKWSVDGNGDPLAVTNAGPCYTITPEIASSYLPPIDGGAGDLFSILPLETDYTEFWNRSFSKGPIIFNETNKFYMPVIVYGADVDGGGPDYSVAIIEFLDDATPTTVGHLTDFSLGATLPVGGFQFTNMCWNGTDNTIWISISDNDVGAVIDDRVIVVETATWTTTTLTMPDQILCYGLEYSESVGTTGGVLATGVDADVGSTQNGVAMFYDCDANTWTTLTNPSGDPNYYGCGIYDDTSNWVFTITGGDPTVGSANLYYWGKNDSTTIVDTGVEFSTDLAKGAFRVASNTFIYDPTGTPKYSTTVVLSGHDKVGIAEVNTTDCSVSFVKLVDDNYTVWGSTYIGKFQRPIFYIDGAQQYVISHPVGSISTWFTHGVTLIDASPGVYVNYYVDEFTAISDLYRSKAYGIVNGYVVLFGLLEYDTGTDIWSYTPRRIRWTAPATVNDFAGTGSGTADVLGNGEFIDARTVNERIVMFESNAISTLVPRGIVEDPFDYEVIHRGIRAASNPCVVNDVVYFVASDGLLYSSNGITVDEIGASFDLTKFDDFDDQSPAWLVYSVELNSLLVFYPNSTTQTVHSISLANGSVCSWNILDSGNNYPLKSVVAVESSSNVSTYLAYDPQSSGSTYDEVCSISVLDTGSGIDGVDNLTKSIDGGNWYAELETGNLYSDEMPEGIKFALKHIIVHTYTDSTSVTYNPDIIIEVKSVEDTGWSGANDSCADSAFTITDSTAALSSSAPPTATSTLLGSANGTAITYNLPWIAANCRIYTKTGTTYTACTLVTTTPDAANEYQITATKQIKVYGTNGHSVYCFCDNEPSVKIKAGDYIEATSGLLRITAIPTYLTATLCDNPLSGLTGSHVYAEQIPIGSGTVKVGINKLIEGAKIRIRVVPRDSSGSGPSIVKITGISLGYIPLGEKILEATGG